MYYQNYIELFNHCNPGGEITSDKRYRNLLIYSICLGVLVAVKRFSMGLRFGKASYFRYADKLSQILKELLLISKVTKSSKTDVNINLEDLDNNSVLEKWNHAGEVEDDRDDMTDTASKSPGIVPSPAASPSRRMILDQYASNQNFLTESQNFKISELLGDWEDIELNDKNGDNDADLSSIVQFRASVSVLDSIMPYSPAFGITKTRAQVISGSQNLYLNLLEKQQLLQGRLASSASSNPILRFHTIALTALKSNGEFDQKLCKELVTLFRPARNGNITLIEFCKSIDNQYKELRKLRASITNEGRMNTATEQLVNVIFYGIMFMVCLGVIGM